MKKLLILVLPKQQQEEIAKMIKQSFTLRKEAKQLLDEATRKVEKILK